MSGKETKKLDTAIVVAIIGVLGTIIAALIASPVFGKLFEETTVPNVDVPTVGDNGLVFVNDFENGQASGFAFSSEEWQVMKDKGNQVLEMSGTGSENSTAVFGPNDFSNGEIIFRINFKNLGGFILNFRSSVDVQTYTLYLAPASGEITLGYGNATNDWNLEPFEGDSIRPFQFNEGSWYQVKLQASGGQMTVWMDGNKILSGTDVRLELGSMEFAIQSDGTVWLDEVEVWEYSN